jgi:dihydrofolate reductase
MMSVSLDGFIGAPGGDLSWHQHRDLSLVQARSFGNGVVLLRHRVRNDPGAWLEG